MDILIKRSKIFFRRDDIIQVWRLPPTKTLRAHLFGLTLGLVGAFFIIALDRPTLFGCLPWYTALVAIGIFILGTYLGGSFVILTAILFFLKNILPPAPLIFSSLTTIAVWYFLFYAVGAVFTTLYNVLVYLDLIAFGKNQLKLAFAYDPRKRINIIKSPIEGEEQAFDQLIASSSELEKQELKKQKLYSYELREPPRDPYTIALVANPKIRRRPDRYDRDPIMSDLDLFLRTINDTMHSFELDEVLGKQEIWSRVRIITIFDDAPAAPDGAKRPDNSLSFVQDFQADVDPQKGVAENLIYPRPETFGNLKALLLQNRKDLPPVAIEHIDVIFALSASPTQIRHTAYYADFDETQATPPQPQPPKRGTKFIYDPDPNNQKVGEINAIHCGTPPFACIHDDYSAIPGRAAINVLSARRHTFIHEFAHAMSSAVRGAICDEYYDKSFLRTRSGSIFVPFYVNRIERVERPLGQFVPTHPVFAGYNEVIFPSDLAHPSAQAGWLSYFPERHSISSEHCTMDRSAEPFRFDKLISRFMYERLVSKSNRPH